MRDSVWGIKVSEWVYALGSVPLLRCHVLVCKINLHNNDNHSSSLTLILIKKSILTTVGLLKCLCWVLATH